MQIIEYDNKGCVMFSIHVFNSGELRVRREFDDVVVARAEFRQMVSGWEKSDYGLLVSLEWEAELCEEIDGEVVRDLDAWDPRHHPSASGIDDSVNSFGS